MMKPLLRAVKFKYLYYAAKYKSSGSGEVCEFPTAFLVGCGRSGTTLAGRLLSQCPEVSYHNEPYHLWLAIHEESDVTNLHRVGSARYFLEAADLKQDQSAVFRRLFEPAGSDQLMLEKTPHNVCRIGFLRELAPNAKFLNIVRNGMPVCASIKTAAQSNPYRILGKPHHNVWWGYRGVKWQSLKNDCIRLGYVDPEEAELLEDDEQKAALEWVVSVEAFSRWRDECPKSCHEFTYDELVNEPRLCLPSIADFLELRVSEEWIDQCEKMVQSDRKNTDITIKLPSNLLARFNTIQEQYGFPGRGIVL